MAAPVIAEPVIEIPVVSAVVNTTAVVAEVAATEPVLTAPAPAPVAKPAIQAAPAANLDEVLKAAGLMMAVTNPDKLRAVQAAATMEMPAAAPVGRERKPVVTIAEQPLVQIETQR